MDEQSSQELTVAAAPDIPGLRFRRWRGDADYPVLLALNTASKIADGMDDDLHTLDTLRHSYRPMPGYLPARDMVIAEVDGTPVACTRVVVDRLLDGSGEYWHVGFVLPDWRGRGIGRALLGWLEDHSRALQGAQPAGDPVFLQADVDRREPRRERLVQRLGYTAVRYEFNMATPDLDHIPDVPVPPGLEIRPVTPDQYPAIWEAMTEAFRDHWGASLDD
ncbi:MAG TPA: GNAT family N-acetyltransferase, partial [Chloroflexia bacterium]|nr:GNAT family N-acetyltransferase [Chloroflexia bacterium]